jgi:hypothetical protein
MHRSPIIADYGYIIPIFAPTLLSQEGFSSLEILELSDYVSLANHEPYSFMHCVFLSLGYILLVPKKLDIDWKAIEGMYMMGMQPEVICSTYRINNHTLTSKIVRGGWKGKKDALLARKEVVVQEARSQMVANAGTAYQERLTKHVEAGLAVLDDNLPTTRPEVSQHFDALGKVDKIAVRAYGLESTVHGSQSTTLNLNLLRVDATPCTAETSVKKAEVIDVQ